MTNKKKKRLRVPGHALTVEWSREYGVHRSSTGTCKCGWQESHFTGWGVRQEYRWHLERVLDLQSKGLVPGKQPTSESHS